MKFLYVIFIFTLSPDTSIESVDLVMKKEVATLEECNQLGRQMSVSLEQNRLPYVRSVSTCIELP